MKAFARWLYVTMYHEELVMVARDIRSHEPATTRELGMIDTLEMLDLLE